VPIRRNLGDSERDIRAFTARHHAWVAPSLIRPFAPIVARAAAIVPGDRVLDVACGTGVLAPAARSSGST
jgi:predicted RNA methylase